MNEKETAICEAALRAARTNTAWASAVRALPLDKRAEAVVEEILGSGEISLGEALRLAYPEACTGDLAPGADWEARRGLTVMVNHWVQSNIEDAH